MAQLTFFNPDTGENLFEGEGQATVHISRRKWKRLKRAFTMQRPRIPRKLKKAARHIHIEIVNENFNVVEPFSKGGSDVNLQVDVDYRIRVDGRRTRSVERMVAKARWMLSKAYRDMVQHHIDEMKKACKPGMLTYEPPVVPEMLMPSEETAEQIRRDDIHLHLCHDCPHWQDGDEGPQCEYPRPFPLDKCIADVLEDNVDERFFLKPDSVIKFLTVNESTGSNDIHYTITDHKLSDEEIAKVRSGK